jgi:hypothetical protein
MLRLGLGLPPLLTQGAGASAAARVRGGGEASLLLRASSLLTRGSLAGPGRASPHRMQPLSFAHYHTACMGSRRLLRTHRRGGPRRRAGGTGVGALSWGAALEARGAAIGEHPLREEALAQSVSPPSIPSVCSLFSRRRWERVSESSGVGVDGVRAALAEPRASEELATPPNGSHGYGARAAARGRQGYFSGPGPRAAAGHSRAALGSGSVLGEVRPVRGDGRRRALVDGERRKNGKGIVLTVKRERRGEDKVRWSHGQKGHNYLKFKPRSLQSC